MFVPGKDRENPVQCAVTYRFLVKLFDWFPSPGVDREITKYEGIHNESCQFITIFSVVQVEIQRFDIVA